MRIRTMCRLLGVSAAALGLAACGGGDTQSSFIPAAPTAPMPTPSPSPAPAPAPVPPPPPTIPTDIQSSAPFATYAAYFGGPNQLTQNQSVQFAYDESSGKYLITLPGFQPGRLVVGGADGSFYENTGHWTDIYSTSSDVTFGTSDATQRVLVILSWPSHDGYKYTGFGNWLGGTGYTPGVFAYGIPTAVGDVPLAGTAIYTGSVMGVATDGYGPISGTVSLTFDYGHGALTGVMKPETAGFWDPVSLGDYTLRDTNFAKGATSFSGSFHVPGSDAPSSFQGSFTGRQAAELMANWTAPFQVPGTQQWGSMSGVWIAKKP